jgi:hypothetical protein
LRSVHAYFTEYNIVGVQFTFNNGDKDYVTDLFGISQNAFGKPTTSQVYNVTETLTSVSQLMVNT